MNGDRMEKFLAGFGESDPPPGFRERLMTAARPGLERNRERGRESALEALLRPLDWWRMAGAGLRAAALTAVAAGLILGVALGPQIWNGAPEEPAAADAGLFNDGMPALLGEDCLGETPEGSLSESYLAWVAGLAEEVER